MAATSTVAAPLTIVFDAIANFANLAAWDPFVRRSTLEAGRNLEPGAVYSITAVGGMSLHYRLIAAEPPHRATYQGGTRNVTSTDMIAVVETAEGSRVTIETTIEFRGWTRLLAPIVRVAVVAGGQIITLPALRRYVKRAGQAAQAGMAA